MKEKTNEKEIEQHSLMRSAVLHLLPGVLIMIFILLIGALLNKYRYPVMVTILLATVFVSIPFELGYLLHQGKKTNGRFSLHGIVLFREPISKKHYFTIVFPSFIWLSIILVVVSPLIDGYIIKKFFFWMPDFLTCGQLDLANYSHAFLVITSIFAVALNGLIAPLVEELYFRGYLLPRLSRYGQFAPVINTILFSLYHFFTPWQNLGRIVALLPMVYGVWSRRSIKIGIIVHCCANTLFTLLAIIMFILS